MKRLGWIVVTILCFVNLGFAEETGLCQVELVGHYGPNANGLTIVDRHDDHNERNFSKNGLTEAQCNAFCDSYENKEYVDIKEKMGRLGVVHTVTKRFFIEYVESCDWGFFAHF